jgi:hypothetical protein
MRGFIRVYNGSVYEGLARWGRDGICRRAYIHWGRPQYIRARVVGRGVYPAAGRCGGVDRHEDEAGARADGGEQGGDAALREGRVLGSR